MELVSLYPYDPTARATSNKIENESITVIPPTQVTDYSYVIPRAAPFYASTLVVKDGKTAGARTLVENVDYWCVIDFLSASVGLGKRVSVGIALLDPSYSGTLYVSYQTLGGNYTMADYSVLEELVRERYVVKHVSYEQVINLPEGFAPEWHQHEVGDMVGMGSVVTSLNNIKLATEGRNGSYGQIQQEIQNHVTSTAAHKPADVGLGNVKNYTTATLTEAKAGSVNRYVTADILKQYVTFEKQDISVFLTKTDATLTYATLSNLNSYYTKTQGDSRYAYKSDSYTKTQVDDLIDGIAVGDLLGNYYTKTQADNKYFLKTDITSYITTATADGKYVAKSDLNNYYTKSQGDSRYAGKSDSYTKSESDNKYATISAYLSTSSASSTYQTKSAMNDYYTKSQSNVVENSRINWMPYPWPDYDYMMQLVVTGPGGSNSDSRMYFNLDKHAKINDVYTKQEIDNKLSGGTGVYHVTFSRANSYKSYTNLTVEWTMLYSPAAGTVSISAVVTTPFYLDEDYEFVFNTGPATYLNGAHNTTTERLLSFYSDNAVKNINVDYDVRPGSDYATFSGNGQIVMKTSFSTDSSSDYKYTTRLFASCVIPIVTTNNHRKIMQWFSEAHKWTPPA